MMDWLLFLIHHTLKDPVMAFLDIVTSRFRSVDLFRLNLSLSFMKPAGLGIPRDPTSIVTRSTAYPAARIDCVSY